MRASARLVLTAGIVTMLAGCARDGGQSAGLDDLRRELNGSRVCAVLIAPQWPIESSAANFARPGVDALVAAGLVRRDPVVAAAAADTPMVRIAVTAAGRTDLRLYHLGAGNPPQPQLCFGRKQVTAITQQDPAADLGSGPVQYRYRIVDAPAWTQRPDMRAAFPFVTRLLGAEQTAEIGAVKRDGQWHVAGGADQAGMMEIGNKGFLPCPYEGASAQDDPCR